VSHPPTGPAASNQTPKIASRANTTRPMPRASRAHGERICRTGVFGGALGTLRFLEAFVFEVRDDERREGEVFVATGPPAIPP
jgi:hypothetical protein